MMAAWLSLAGQNLSAISDWLPDRWKAAQNVRLTGFAPKREFAR
jgi:hypothetical protein